LKVNIFLIIPGLIMINFHNIEKYREDFMFGLHLFDTIHHGLLKNNKYFSKISIR